MIVDFLLSFFGWMPPLMQVLVAGVVGIFVIWSVVKIIAVVMDIIPFL